MNAVSFYALLDKMSRSGEENEIIHDERRLEVIFVTYWEPHWMICFRSI